MPSSPPPVNPRPVQLGDDGVAASAALAKRAETLAETAPGLAAGELARLVRTLHSVDRQYGGHRKPLPLADAEDLVTAALAETARIETAARRGESAQHAPEIAAITVGIALWAMRHDVAIAYPEPVANALALTSNAARSREELAAAFGLMQGVVAHVAPRLAADLERSNPERPWRVLHANLAITAIRTEDAAMMEHAFDALDAALPDERGAFYAEALALAMAPRVAPAVREAIEARHRRWNLR